MTRDVLLGYCHMGSVRAEMMEAVLQTFTYDHNHDSRLTGYIGSRGLYLAEQRCNMVRQFLDTDCAWLWMVDGDIVFPEDALDRLLAVASEDRPIVAAAYWNEYANTCAVTWLIADDDGFHPVVRLPEDPDRGEIAEISACGMGCTLIHRSVFETLAAKHADDPWPWFGHDIINNGSGPERIGEDLTFCSRAKLAGFSVWGLPSLTVEHVKAHQMRHGAPELERVS
jgi:hypothetical protein